MKKICIFFRHLFFSAYELNIMFASSDPNLLDLDFGIYDDKDQNLALEQSIIKDLLSLPTSANTTVKQT